MRTIIVFIALLLYTTLVKGAESLTSNLVNNQWTNGYSVPELTCWKGGDPNCSPGTPYIRPDGSINFSYNYTELFQARSLADALPYSGIGLMATGFQFNWRSKNGNYWDDARQDQLSAYVQMYSKSGQWIEAQSYSLNYIHDWTDFSWTGTFTKERRNSDLGTILYGFSGKDNNYWAGPYGPEIVNVSFQLRYRPDPCVVNPLHSTECPGFLAAINKPIPGILETSNYTVSMPSNSLATLSNLNTGIGIVKLNAQRDLLQIDNLDQQNTNVNKITSQAAVLMPPTPITQSNKSYSSRSQEVQSLEQEQAVYVSIPTTTIITSLPQVTKPVQKSDSQLKPDSSTDSILLDQVLITPQTNQQAFTNITSLQTVSPRSSTDQIYDSDTSTTTQFTLVKTPESVYAVVEQSQSVLPEKSTQDNTFISSLNTNQSIVINNTLEQPQVEFVKTIPVDTNIIDTPTNNIANALIDRTNPLNDMLNGQQMVQSGPVFTGPAVKSDTADNDLAGGVSISQIARVPTGFDVYTNLVIREIAFYQPREIYRGQRTVDNVRALQNLRSDRLHEQMINQQWR